MRALTTFAALLAVALGSLLVYRTDRAKMAERTQRPEVTKVRIRLPGKVGEVEGFAPPQSVFVDRITGFQIEEPTTVTIVLPGGRETTIESKTTFVNVRYGVVVDVDLLPLMATLPYKEARARLMEDLRAMKIEPDASIKKHMDGWAIDSPGFEAGKNAGFYPLKSHATTHTPIAGDESGPNVTPWIELRPAGDGGWYYVITLQVDMATRRALRDPDFRKNKGAGEASRGKNPGNESKPKGGNRD